MSTTRYAVFILLRATEQWLRLTREARRRLSDEHVGTALQRLPALKLRYFDAEAFSADCSDIMLIETTDTVQKNTIPAPRRQSAMPKQLLDVAVNCWRTHFTRLSPYVNLERAF